MMDGNAIFLKRYYLWFCLDGHGALKTRSRFIAWDELSDISARDEKVGRLLSGLGITKNIRGRLIATIDNTRNVITMYTRTGASKEASWKLRIHNVFHLIA